MTDVSLGMTTTVGSYVFAGSKPEKNAIIVDQVNMILFDLWYIH